MSSDTDKIAVIGMAGKFPGASNIHEYWSNLIEGKETISMLSDEILSKYEVNYQELKLNPNYVKARGVLDNIDQFDALFFGMTPKEARYTDPQHRIWLETTWQAFEDAGIDPFVFKGAIGVYAGSYINTYLLNNILRDPVLYENYVRLRSTESFQLMTGNDSAYIPTKTAYKFNLKGPAVNVQTACSTSLVAIIHACQSLFSYESDICIGGGVCILTPQETGYLYQEGAIPSPDGHCRPFDAQAKGTVFSNGIGIVVLKRLEDAVRDHDRIYSVISGWALNNDGNKKVSYTAPSIDGQTEAILMAQSFAGVSPDDIGYVETHGTATALGDPIEIAALNKAFSLYTTRKQFCGIGSVKSNIGHTDAAAGVASFIKACLSAYYRKIPPSLNYREPNPHIDFINTPFYVQSELKEWTDNKPLIIGISSFGIGGTNAHVIIEEPSRHGKNENPVSEWPFLAVLSAKTEGACLNRKIDLTSSVLQNKLQDLSNLAYMLQTGRSHMACRSFAVLNSIEDFKNDNVLFTDGISDNSQKSMTFVFPGQGAQYVNMGRDLYEHVNAFKNTVDKLFELFKKITGDDLKPIIFNSDNNEQCEKLLAQTQFTQPALFIIEFAITQVFTDFGIKPDYLIGHSIGEFVAACVADVFDVETGLKIVIKRGQLMQSMPSGNMFAVRSNKNELIRLHSEIFEIAAENTHMACTISFKKEDSEAVKNFLTRNNITFVPLNTSHAFHSMVFEPIMDEFSAYVNQFSLKSPKIPFISSLTGKFIENSEVQSGAYWANQLRHTVLFNSGIDRIAGLGSSLFIEMGPNTHLSSFIKTNKLVTNKSGIIATIGKADSNIMESIRIISTLGNLWLNGYELKFNYLNDFKSCHKITLPDYPFEKKGFWIDYFPPNNGFSSHPNLDSTLPMSDTKPLPLRLEISNTKLSLKKLLTELSEFSMDELLDNKRFSDFGFDSLFLAQFSQKLEQSYAIKILFRELVSEYSTIDKLTSFIESRKVDQVSNVPIIKTFSDKNLKNLGFLSKEGSHIPFVLVHGSNSVNFLTPFFEGDRPVLNFFDIGSDGEKINCATIDEMAQLYIDQLHDLIPQGPYVLCGFSFGGLLAYKMAELLQNSGKDQVPCLIIFDCKTPQALEPNRIKKVFTLVKGNKIKFLWNAALRRLKKIQFYYVYFIFNKPLPVKYRRKYISSIYLKLGKNYSPSSLNSELQLFRSEESLAFDPYMGWKKLARNVELNYLEGNHLGIIYLKENYQIISNKIGAFLKQSNC